jgi:hypothetical protein
MKSDMDRKTVAVRTTYKPFQKSPFDVSGDKPMPHPQNNETPQRVYAVDMTIGIKIQDNFIVPYFTNVAQEYLELDVVSPGPDGSLDIRVPQGQGRCRFTIALDGHQWMFDDVGHDIMTFGGDVPDDIIATYYPRYRKIDQTSFEFDAIPIDVGDNNQIPAYRHGFNLYIKLLQPNGANALPLRIDPDIINPGNHPFEDR